MRTSGSTDFSLNRNEIIEMALRASSVRGVGLTPSAEEIDTCSKVFNMMLSDWQAQHINVAMVKDITIFPRYGISSYPLGPYGYDATEFYYQTELYSDAAADDVSVVLEINHSDEDSICASQSVASATTLVLNGVFCAGGKAKLPVARKLYMYSTTGESDVIFTVVGKSAVGATQTEEITISSGVGTIYSGTKTFSEIDSITSSALCTGSIKVGTYGVTAGDFVLIQLDDGTLHREIIQACLPQKTATSVAASIKSGLPSAASEGNAVFVYPTKISKPLDILSTRSYSLEGLESALTRYAGKSEYFELSGDKSLTGTPTMYYYDPGVDMGTFYLYPAPSDVTTVFKCQAQMPIEDLDTSAQNAYFPREWHNALVLNLAVSICPYFGKDPSQFLFAQAADALAKVRRFENKNRSFRMIPHISG